MEVITNLKDCACIPDSVVTVGTFDGVHLAHQKIIQQVIKCARTKNAVSTVVTFDPHPRLVINQKELKPIALLTTTEEKIELIQKSGIDRLVIIPFTVEFSEISPQSFIIDILYKTIGMRVLISGYRHFFGRHRAGNVDYLRQLEKNNGFEVYVQKPISNHYGLISSTRIREFIVHGEIEAAGDCLGRMYFLGGNVIPGDGRGQFLGYPTANIQIDNPHKCIPKNGIYAVNIEYGDTIYDGVMYIGSRPTFHLSGISFEIHIFNFNEIIYGKKIRIKFIEKIRDDICFESAESLKTQIKSDIEQTKSILLRKKEQQ